MDTPSYRDAKTHRKKAFSRILKNALNALCARRDRKQAFSSITKTGRPRWRPHPVPTTLHPIIPHPITIHSFCITFPMHNGLWTDGRTDGTMDGRTDGWTDGQTNRRTNGRTDPLIEPKMCTAGQRVLLTITGPGPSFLLKFMQGSGPKGDDVL